MVSDGDIRFWNESNPNKSYLTQGRHHPRCLFIPNKTENDSHLENFFSLLDVNDDDNDNKLPLTLLSVATGSPLLVELKGGDTYNGRLVSFDSWMNMNLTDVICTSKEGDRFWKLSSCYIRGSAVKYLRLPPELLEKAKVAAQQEQHHQQQQQQHQSHFRGGRGARGGRDGGRGRVGGARGRGRGIGRGGRGARGGGRGRSVGRGRDGGGRSLV